MENLDSLIFRLLKTNKKGGWNNEENIFYMDVYLLHGHRRL